MNILVINCGSSSIRYELFRMPKEKVLAKGLLENIGERKSKIRKLAHELEVQDPHCLVKKELVYKIF